MLARFPLQVRLSSLLPEGVRERTASVRLQARGGEPRFLTRHAGQWWLQVPAGGVETFSPLARAYHGTYPDRRARFAGQEWLLASPRQVGNLLYEVTETPVLEFPGEPLTEAQLEGAGLQPPLRRAELALAGGDTVWSVELGEPAGEPAGERLWARRDGTPVLTDITALRTIEQPTSALLDLGALSFQLAAADSFHLEGSSGPVLYAHRVPSPQHGWRVSVPAGQRLAVPAERAAELAGDLVVYLDRLSVRAVLPPTDRSPLVQEGSFALTVWGDAHGLADPTELHFGLAVPVVAAGLEAEPDSPGVVLMRDALTGRTLQVPAEILVSFRALRALYR